MDAELFREEQRFRQPFLWLTLGAAALLVIGLFIWGMVQQLILIGSQRSQELAEALHLCRR